MKRIRMVILIIIIIITELVLFSVVSAVMDNYNKTTQNVVELNPPIGKNMTDTIIINETLKEITLQPNEKVPAANATVQGKPESDTGFLINTMDRVVPNVSPIKQDMMNSTDTNGGYTPRGDSISAAGKTTDNVSTTAVDINTYQIPELQFNKSQNKVFIHELLLSPIIEKRGLSRTIPMTGDSKNLSSLVVPVGAIIHHSKDGITTVFDKTGKQLFCADDAQASMISTTEGMIPATYFHTIPLGSKVHFNEQAAYIENEDGLLFIEIDEKSHNQTSITSKFTSGKVLNATEKGLKSPILLSDQFSAPIIEFAGNDHPIFYPSDYFTAQWTVPDSPRLSGDYSPTYIFMGMDEVYLYGYSRTWVNYKSILEYDHHQNAWSIYSCNFIQNEGRNPFSYCWDRILVHPGNVIQGRIGGSIVYNPHPNPTFRYINADITNLFTGQRISGSLSNPIDSNGYDTEQLSLNLQGDLDDLNEDTIVGDTIFTQVNFLFSPSTYVNNINPRLPHLNIENNWPESIVFYTLHTPTNRDLIIDIKDLNSDASIPHAAAGLWDFDHNEWQNLTTLDGTVSFNTSGSSHQFPLVIGNTYRVVASATGYIPVTRNVTFNEYGQWETVKLGKGPGPEVYSYSMTNMEFYRQTHENLAVPALDYYPGTGIYTNMSMVLEREGWQLAFYHHDSAVAKEDFGTRGGGLNNATFHYHFGHGNSTQALTFYEYRFETDGTIPKLEQPYLTHSIHYSELGKQWGNKNKWVLIDACSVLENNKWGQALGTSHGILGFASNKMPSQDLPNSFFTYALEENKTVLQSYKQATFESFTKNVTAAAIFDNDYQWNQDHLPGHGEVAPDETPDDLTVKYETWPCGGGPADDAFYN